MEELDEARERRQLHSECPLEAVLAAQLPRNLVSATAVVHTTRQLGAIERLQRDVKRLDRECLPDILRSKQRLPLTATSSSLVGESNSPGGMHYCGECLQTRCHIARISVDLLLQVEQSGCPPFVDGRTARAYEAQVLILNRALVNYLLTM